MDDAKKIAGLYLENFEKLDHLSPEAEMDILKPDNEVRHYRIGDKVKLHKGGEGVIRGIVYCVLIGDDGENDAILIKGEDMGDIIG